MAARVFAYALAEDADRYTAAELAEGLRISPAAVSGAVRFLTSTRLLFKRARARQRADIYRVYDDDVWSTIMGARLPDARVVGAAPCATRREIVGRDTAAGAGSLETEEFFRFTRDETEAMMERWQHTAGRHVDGASRSAGGSDRSRSRPRTARRPPTSAGGSRRPCRARP